MGSYSWVKQRADELHKINFEDIIKYKNVNLNNVYENAFGAEKSKSDERYASDGFCTKCDYENSYVPAEENAEKKYKLTNISHGTHTLDFLHSFGLEEDEIKTRIDGSWIDDPVLFLMENPSTGDFYKFAECNNQRKRPVNNWYWIHGSQKDNFKKGYFEDDTYLVQQQYGKMVASLIYQFKLGNAYLTNIVKCGMTDAVDDVQNETGYKNLENYSKDCKQKCIESILGKEIEALCEYGNQLKPVRIFAFGERPYWMVLDYLKNCTNAPKIKYQVYQLPHPASRERNLYRKHILRGILEEAFISDGFKETGLSGKNIKIADIWSLFNNIYLNTMPLGLKVTNNQYALKMSSYSSIFSKNEIVTEIWMKGETKNDMISSRWGIGYVFETNSYWYWDYDNDKPFEDKKSIPYVDLFEKAINEVLNM